LYFDIVLRHPLREGLIHRRRNRFILDVEVNGIMCDCHCPTTGRIGNIVLRDIPCLISKSNDIARKTLYTVEVISLDLPSENKNPGSGLFRMQQIGMLSIF
jgi:sugar fermentation stimulation protein A